MEKGESFIDSPIFLREIIIKISSKMYLHIRLQ